MQRDVDYVVRDGQIMHIVDEFTRRLMFGRRYNEGLHQAIEAKEGLKVQNESKTQANSSTFQNFFRLYGKLSRYDRYCADRGRGVPLHLQAGRYRSSDQPSGYP